MKSLLCQGFMDGTEWTVVWHINNAHLSLNERGFSWNVCFCISLRDSKEGRRDILVATVESQLKFNNNPTLS